MYLLDFSKNFKKISLQDCTPSSKQSLFITVITAIIITFQIDEINI